MPSSARGHTGVTIDGAKVWHTRTSRRADHSAGLSRSGSNYNSGPVWELTVGPYQRAAVTRGNNNNNNNNILIDRANNYDQPPGADIYSPGFLGLGWSDPPPPPPPPPPPLRLSAILFCLLIYPWGPCNNLDPLLKFLYDPPPFWMYDPPPPFWILDPRLTPNSTLNIIMMAWMSCLSAARGVVAAYRGGGTKKKVGGLTLPLNDCTEAGVQGLHSEEFLFPLASEKVVGLSPPPPTPQSGWAESPSAPPAPPPLAAYFFKFLTSRASATLQAELFVTTSYRGEATAKYYLCKIM